MKIRTVVVFVLSLFGLMPLMVLIFLNLPGVLSRMEAAAETRQVMQLLEEFQVLHNLMERRRESLRVFSINPGSRELAGSTEGNVPIEVIRKRFGGMMIDWYQNDSDVYHIHIMDHKGREQIRIKRQENGLLGLLSPAEFRSCENKSFFIEGIAADPGIVYSGGVNILDEMPGHPHIILQLGVKVKARPGGSDGVAAIGFDLSRFLEKFPGHTIFRGDGLILSSPERNGIVSSAEHGLVESYDLLQERLLGTDPFIDRGKNGEMTAYMPLISDIHLEHSIWVSHPVDETDVMWWIASFRIKLALVLGCIVLGVLVVAIWGASRIDLKLGQLRTGLDELLHLGVPLSLTWRRPKELADLSSDLLDLSRRYLAGREEDLLAAMEIQNLNRRNSMLLATAAEGIIGIDSSGVVIFINSAAAQILGYEVSELTGKTDLHETIHPVSENGEKNDKEECHFCKTGRLLLERIEWQDYFRRKDGEFIYVSCSSGTILNEDGTSAGAVMFFSDITEKKRQKLEMERMRQQLEQSQKMEAIGLMAGGVAHDLNNILTGIVGYPDIILRQMEETSAMRGMIEAIKASGKRAGEVVSDLLTVARGVTAQREVVNLNSLVCEYLESPEWIQLSERYEKIKFSCCCGENLANVLCSPIHLKKCVMNLVLNAAEAIGGREGEITIATANGDPSGPGLATGKKCVSLAVTDSGRGIAPKDIEHIFEPFYSKKKMGRSGTGLGLAVVWNSVHEHQGEVRVDSVVNCTTFTILLPITDKKKMDYVPLTDIALLSGRGEKIAVVDDEAQQRDILEKMLRDLGYEPQVFASGEEAIDYLRKEKVQLLLLDMIMAPGINGYQTYKEVLKLYSDQRCVIVSGFADSEEIMKMKKLGVELVVKKPFQMSELAIAVHQGLRDGAVNNEMAAK